MARRTHAGAASGLALCVRRGRRWRASLDALEEAGGEALVGSVIRPTDVEQLLLSVGAEELADAALVGEAPWATWALSLPALRFVAAARANRTAEPEPFSVQSPGLPIVFAFRSRLISPNVPSTTFFARRTRQGRCVPSSMPCYAARIRLRTRRCARQPVTAALVNGRWRCRCSAGGAASITWRTPKSS